MWVGGWMDGGERTRRGTRPRKGTGLLILVMEQGTISTAINPAASFSTSENCLRVHLPLRYQANLRLSRTSRYKASFKIDWDKNSFRGEKVQTAKLGHIFVETRLIYVVGSLWPWGFQRHVNRLSPIWGQSQVFSIFVKYYGSNGLIIKFFRSQHFPPKWNATQL